MGMLRLSRRARRAMALSAAVTAGVAVLGPALPADAAPTTPSIAIKFGTEQPVAGTTVTGPAGVLNTRTWNNTSGNNSASPQVVVADIGGTSTAVGTTVAWTSANTWASTGLGEENNTAPAGENRDLMSGYLDTAGAGGQGVSITVANIPPVPAFDVYVYMQGGVNGRGGTYTISGITKEHTGDSAFAGTFLEDTIDPGTTAGSNYIVFRNLTGTGFTLTGTPTIGNPARAPVNAIEIVQTPEPAGLAVLGLAGATLLGRRRRATA